MNATSGRNWNINRNGSLHSEDKVVIGVQYRHDSCRPSHVQRTVHVLVSLASPDATELTESASDSASSVLICCAWPTVGVIAEVETEAETSLAQEDVALEPVVTFDRTAPLAQEDWDSAGWVRVERSVSGGLGLRRLGPGRLLIQSE